MSETFKCSSCFANLDVVGQKRSIVVCDYCGAQTMIIGNGTGYVNLSDSKYKRVLREVIVDTFSVDDIVIVADNFKATLRPPFTTQFYIDNFPATKIRMVLEMIDWCDRRMLLKDFSDIVFEYRPDTQAVVEASLL